MCVVLFWWEEGTFVSPIILCFPQLIQCLKISSGNYCRQKYFLSSFSWNESISNMLLYRKTWSGKNERTDKAISNNSSAEIRLSLTLLLLLLMCEIKHVYHRHFCWASTNCAEICSKLFATYIHSIHLGTVCIVSSILFRLFCKVQQSINCNINIGKLYNFYRISHNYL